MEQIFFESAVPLVSESKLLEGAIYPDNYPSESFRKMYHKRFKNEDQLTFAAAAYEMTLHTARLLKEKSDLTRPQILSLLQQSEPVKDSVLGPFSFVSENAHGQYFQYPIVIKEIRGDHGVKIASYQ